jgi:metal-dependent amidase/aminoacylase/carboxypeptidase family protein
MWRRDFHQNPELGNRKFRTSNLIATHLKSLGLEVKTGIGHTGVVGILRGKKDSHEIISINGIRLMAYLAAGFLAF